MSEHYKIRTGKYPEKLQELEQGEYRGDSWNVKAIKGKYVLSFVSGSLSGKVVTQEVTKEEYDLAVNGNFNLNEICRKYSIG